jgi:hypothetical protein
VQPEPPSTATHVALTQTVPPSQAIPQAPQLQESMEVATHMPEPEQPSGPGPESRKHIVGAAEGQSPTHEYLPPPNAQTGSAPQQRTPQAPQLFGSFNAPHSPSGPVSASAITTSEPASIGQPKRRLVQFAASPAAASIASSNAASRPLLDPEPLPELPPGLPPLDDDAVASVTPASPPWLFEPETPHPAPSPTTAAARPVSTDRARPDVNGFPTSPAQRQGPRLSSGGGVVAEMAARAADGDPGGRACDGQGR